MSSVVFASAPSTAFCFRLGLESRTFYDAHHGTTNEVEAQLVAYDKGR